MPKTHAGRAIIQLPDCRDRFIAIRKDLEQKIWIGEADSVQWFDPAGPHHGLCRIPAANPRQRI